MYPRKQSRLFRRALLLTLGASISLSGFCDWSSGAESALTICRRDKYLLDATRHPLSAPTRQIRMTANKMSALGDSRNWVI